jgi:ribonuclease HII
VKDIAGVDEAGVAPLAGPVVAAAVMFPPQAEIAGVDDSKRLDAQTRMELAKEIRAKASGVSVGIASVEEIDTVNIYHASLLAMRRAVEGLPRAPQHVLVDARTVPGIPMPQNAFNKGDGINFTIAAASIIAKTERDAMMEALDREYPGYGFAAHKGYPTPDHREALLKLGRTRVHRMSFPVLHEWFGEYSPCFYALKTQLFEAASRAALEEFENALKTSASALTEAECRKLRLLVGRRWKVVA